MRIGFRFDVIILRLQPRNVDHWICMLYFDPTTFLKTMKFDLYLLRSLTILSMIFSLFRDLYDFIFSYKVALK